MRSAIILSTEQKETDLGRQLAISVLDSNTYAFQHEESKVAFHDYAFGISENLTAYYASYLTMLQWDEFFTHLIFAITHVLPFL